MQKAYNRINWENYPSDRTPLNETNLNKLDVGVNELDNRIISIDNTKFDKTEASTLIKNFELDKTTGVITITYLSGATVTIDTMLEKLAVNFDFDQTEQRLVITLDDGTVKYVNLKSLITQYEFTDTDTVAFSVDADGNVSAIVKDGSIQERHLRPDYLADIRVESAKAEASAIRAEQAENNAVTSADNATQFVDEAMRQLEAGELKGDRGSVIHSGNKVHLATGGSPEGIISNFIDGVLAGDYYINENAGDYFICTNVENGKSYWDFIINLKGIEGRRGSKIFVAEDDVFFPPLNVQEQAYTNDIIINSTTGDMYEVTGDNNSGPSSYFDYKLVGNIKGPKGDVAASAVTGIKGNAETNYRTGDVNITPENIGAIPKSGGAVTGDLNFANMKGIQWQESGYGDKFKIVPNFSGADDQNKLLIQSAVGAANTDPTLNTVVSIAGKTGNTEFVGNVTTKGTLRSECIELNQNGTLTNFGGFIDFHYNGDTADYTSRIVEDNSGDLNVNGVRVNLSNKSVNALKYLINNTDINSIFAKATDISTLQSNFQAGVDTIYNACVSVGSTPSEKTPTGIQNALNTLKTGYGNWYGIMRFINEVGFGTDLLAPANYTFEDGKGIMIMQKGETYELQLSKSVTMSKYASHGNSGDSNYPYKAYIGTPLAQGKYSWANEYSGYGFSDTTGQIISVKFQSYNNNNTNEKYHITAVNKGIDIFTACNKRSDTGAWVSKYIVVIVI